MEWNTRFRELMETNPFCITDDQLFALFALIKVEIWGDGPVVDLQEVTLHDLPLVPIIFCRGFPVVTNTVLAVHKHLRLEYSWDQLSQLIFRVMCT
jgi:hypothetical protein